jgi:hypothetical protein
MEMNESRVQCFLQTACAYPDRIRS